jgi:hypothetical protein
MSTTAKYYPQAIQVIGEALKNIIPRIVDFMVRLLMK